MIALLKSFATTDQHTIQRLRMGLKHVFFSDQDEANFLHLREAIDSEQIGLQTAVNVQVLGKIKRYSKHAYHGSHKRYVPVCKTH